MGKGGSWPFGATIYCDLVAKKAEFQLNTSQSYCNCR